MISVAFVCLGNICRSPTAELVLKRMAEDRGLKSSFNITSYGTSDEEEGNPVYPPSKKTLEAHGIFEGHTARQLTLRDVVNNDYILVMDSQNLMDVLRLTGGKFGEKIKKLGSFAPVPYDIDDPWYTRDFERAYNEIYACCQAFLEYVIKNNRGAFEYDARH